MGAAVSITRLDLTAWELRKAASGEKIVRRRVGYLRLHWYSMAWTAKRRPKPAAWRDGERGQAIRRARVGLGPIRVAAAQRGPLRHTL